MAPTLFRCRAACPEWGPSTTARRVSRLPTAYVGCGEAGFPQTGTSGHGRHERFAMANKWFETVAEAQRRAKKRLPKSVYGALIAGSERGLTVEDNVAAFSELGF